MLNHKSVQTTIYPFNFDFYVFTVTVTMPTEIPRVCYQGEYQCSDSSCIKAYLVCDDICQCGDCSDEEYCGKCLSDFKYLYSLLVPKLFWCYNVYLTCIQVFSRQQFFQPQICGAFISYMFNLSYSMYRGCSGWTYKSFDFNTQYFLVLQCVPYFNIPCYLACNSFSTLKSVQHLFLTYLTSPKYRTASDECNLVAKQFFVS